MIDEDEVQEIPIIEMAADTMTGDLMACLIDEFKAAPDVWQKMPAEQQQDVINRAQLRVRANVRQAVEIIASMGRPVIPATVESVTVKDGIKAVLTLSKDDPQRHELFDAAGYAVLLIVVDDSRYQGGTSQVQPDPDQPALIGFGEADVQEEAAT